MDELEDIARELANAVSDDLRLATGELTEAQFVAELCALKIRRLLLAGLCLLENGYWDSLGQLTRSTFEFWLVGIYALRGGKEALERLNAHFHRSARLALGQETSTELHLKTGEGLKVEQLARDVGALLRESGSELSDFPTQWYEHNYRLESGAVVHGGLLPLRPHFNSEGDEMIVISDPEDRCDHSEKRLGQMIGMLSWLASDLMVSGKKVQSQRFKNVLTRVAAIHFED